MDDRRAKDQQRDSPSPFSSYLEFYDRVYGGSVVERHANPAGGVLFVSAQGAGNWSDARIPELAIGSIVSGSGSYCADLGAGRFRSLIRPQETLVLAPNSGSKIVRDAPHCVLALTIPYDDLRSLARDDCNLPQSGDFGELHARPLADPFTASVLRRIWEALRAPALGDLLFHQGALLTIAGALMRSSAGKKASPRTGGLAPWQLKRAQSVIEDRLADELSLSMLADELGLSPFHFARAFRKSTGMPPHQYLVQRRVLRACRLLETTRASITDIACAVGFGDPSYFARTFARQIGLSPRDYRQMKYRACVSDDGSTERPTASRRSAVGWFTADKKAGP